MNTPHSPHSPPALLTPAEVAGGNALLDLVMALLHLKNDRAIAIALNINPPVISRIRHGVLRLGDSVIIRILEKTNLTIHQIRKYLPAKIHT